MNTWFETFQRRHTVAVVVVLGLALLAAPFLPAFALSSQLVVLAAAVACFGLPHGALDLTLIQGASSGSWRAVASAVLIYLLGAGAVLVAWLQAPVLTLSGFLLIALIHFGLGDTAELRGPQRALESVARGGFSTIAPLLFQPITTLKLFALLVGPDSAAPLNAATAAIMSGAGWLWGASVGAAVLWRIMARRPGWLRATAELVLTTAVFAVLHPLVAFLLYFNFVHSVRHLAELGTARFPGSASHALHWLLRASLPLTVATLGLAALAGVLFGSTRSLDESLIRTIFWTLSSLTVPHMILVAWWHGQGGQPPGDLFAGSG